MLLLADSGMAAGDDFSAFGADEGFQHGEPQTFGPSVGRGQLFTDPPTIKKVQAALLARGFDPGPIDGIFGEKTNASIRLFMFNTTGKDYLGPPNFEVLQLLGIPLPGAAPAAPKPVAATKKAINFRTAMLTDTSTGIAAAAGGAVPGGPTRFPVEHVPIGGSLTPTMGAALGLGAAALILLSGKKGGLGRSRRRAPARRRRRR